MSYNSPEGLQLYQKETPTDFPVHVPKFLGTEKPCKYVTNNESICLSCKIYYHKIVETRS